MDAAPHPSIPLPYGRDAGSSPPPLGPGAPTPVREQGVGGGEGHREVPWGPPTSFTWSNAVGLGTGTTPPSPLTPLQCGVPHVPPPVRANPPHGARGARCHPVPVPSRVGILCIPPPRRPPSAHLEIRKGGGGAALRRLGGPGGAQLTAPVPELQPRRLLRPNRGRGGAKGHLCKPNPGSGRGGGRAQRLRGARSPPGQWEQSRRGVGGGNSTFIDTPKKPRLGDVGLRPPPVTGLPCSSAPPGQDSARGGGWGGVPRL